MRQHTGFIYLEKVLIIVRQTNVCKPKVIGTKGFETPFLCEQTKIHSSYYLHICLPCKVLTPLFKQKLPFFLFS